MRALGILPLYLSLMLPEVALAAGSEKELVEAIKAGNATEVERLLAGGVDAKGKDKDAPPLFWAVVIGSDEIVRLLLKHGADVNARGDDKTTALYQAAKYGRAKEAETLIAAGADVNAETKSKKTPLMVASSEGQLEAVTILLDHGADVNRLDKNGRSALHWAFSGLEFEFLADSSSPSAHKVREAIDYRQLEEIRAMVAPVKGQFRKIALLLLARGADAKLNLEDVYPLGMAAVFGDKELLQVLLDKGADVNYDKWNARESALQAAIAEGQGEIAELLVQRGADVNARNRSKRTPLHYVASFRGSPQLAELIIRQGADINAKDKGGATPLSLAMASRNDDVADLLRQHGAVEK